MAKCYRCQSETELYLAGFPVCPKCADSGNASAALPGTPHASEETRHKEPQDRRHQKPADAVSLHFDVVSYERNRFKIMRERARRTRRLLGLREPTTADAGAGSKR
jgi:hypothetical protein